MRITAIHSLSIAIITILSLSGRPCHAQKITDEERSKYRAHIQAHYPEQLTDPQKKDRKSFSQFGYGLYYFSFPLFAITEFINPHDFGAHSYGEPGRAERNGSLYTCRGGFMDFSHIRAATDWTVFLSFVILNSDSNFSLKHAGGDLQLRFKNVHDLSLADITNMAQKIAFERLEWHEIASWHFHLPNYSISEQQSTFTPEDTYSNYLGTEIGKRVVIRILTQKESLTYSQITSDEIMKMVKSLQAEQTVRASKKAYDITDYYHQLKVPAAKRNTDVWWDSQMLFRDERYVFKRDINIGPQISPWLVPMQEKVGCPVKAEPQVFTVPATASTGKSYYDYYEFMITPDRSLFYAKESGKLLHEPFGAFNSRDMVYIIAHIALNMEKELGPGFDKRDKTNPIKKFGKFKKVFFKW